MTPLEPGSLAGALAGALERVLGDPEGGAAMGLRGRELIMERYTWPVIAGRLVEAYTSFGSGRSS